MFLGGTGYFSVIQADYGMITNFTFVGSSANFTNITCATSCIRNLSGTNEFISTITGMTGYFNLINASGISSSGISGSILYVSSTSYLTRYYWIYRIFLKFKCSITFFFNNHFRNWIFRKSFRRKFIYLNYIRKFWVFYKFIFIYRFWIWNWCYGW